MSHEDDEIRMLVDLEFRGSHLCDISVSTCVRETLGRRWLSTVTYTHTRNTRTHTCHAHKHTQHTHTHPHTQMYSHTRIHQHVHTHTSHTFTRSYTPLHPYPHPTRTPLLFQTHTLSLARTLCVQEREGSESGEDSSSDDESNRKTRAKKSDKSTLKGPQVSNSKGKNKDAKDKDKDRDKEADKRLTGCCASQYVAGCCRVLQGVAVFCSVLQCVLCCALSIFDVKMRGYSPRASAMDMELHNSRQTARNWTAWWAENGAIFWQLPIATQISFVKPCPVVGDNDARVLSVMHGYRLSTLQGW